VWLFKSERLKLLSGFPDGAAGRQIQFISFPLVFLFRALFIQNAVFFLPQVNAEQAISASYAIKQECAVRAVRAIAGPQKTVASVAIIDFVTEFTFMRERYIGAVFALLQPEAMQTVFRMTTLENEIAIFAIGNKVTVIRIFHVSDRHVHMRYCLQ
jgi:hypothetical protein